MRPSRFQSLRSGARPTSETHGTDDDGRWVGDRNGRKVRAGDLVDVPHEGEKVVVDLELREKNDEPIVTFDQIETDVSGSFGWEYADSITLVRRSR